MAPSTATDRCRPIEISTGSRLWAVAFSVTGKRLVSGGQGVRVWRAEDGKREATLETETVNCLTVSKDGKWIAAGTNDQVFVWDATTFQVSWQHEDRPVNAVDFSPDSTRLVSASDERTATAWVIANGKRMQILSHDDVVIAAKYSPEGDRIATATFDSVLVWDGNDGRSLVNIKVTVVPWYNNGLLWFNDHLLVISDGKIKQINASTGSTVSEWPVPDTAWHSCIALPKHAEFIAYSTKRIVTFWDTSTHAQLALTVQHPQGVHSIALSSDDSLLAIGGEGGRIVVKRLFGITEPDIQIDGAVLDSWNCDQLDDAETLLTTAISKSRNPSHHVLASRALVRARLKKWDVALVDAEKAIDIQPSVIAYVAKSIAHVGNEERHKGYLACDMAFKHTHSSHVTFLLLMKAIIVFMAGECFDAISRVDELTPTVHFNSICYVVQAYMYLLLGSSRMDSGNYEGAIQSLQRAQEQVRPYPSQSLFVVSLASGWNFDALDTKIRQRLCEALYAADRTKDAVECFHQLASELGEGTNSGNKYFQWAHDFRQHCSEKLERLGDTAANTQLYVEAISHYSTALSLHPLSRQGIVIKRAKAFVGIGSWKQALDDEDEMTIRISIYRVVCESFETMDRLSDAVVCFHQMTTELKARANSSNRNPEWAPDFGRRCSTKLERLGNSAADAQQYDEAISCYTSALSLNPTSRQDTVIKRSKAYLITGSWRQALDDAEQVITLDPSSPWGYEMKHAALHRAGDYDSAIEAFKAMLSRMAESPDPDIQQHGDQYISPSTTEATIRRIIQKTTHRSPRVLINMISGCLRNREERTAAFESSPMFKELVSSTTTRIDLVRIKREVRQYFRYVMLSHRWEANEPLFHQVIDKVVYELENSPTHDKLKRFCEIVRDAGFPWAWSDTCCINKSDHFVLQEALVAMFEWYQGAAMVLVFLRGVRSSSRCGALVKSIWNTRAWTLQEYIAAKVVHFYTEDWTLYLDLQSPNHKLSPEVILEMEEATKVSAEQLKVLRPGLSSIREKLCLASARETTLVEDAAYSLLGILSATGLPAIYGEGNKSLGRLLAHVVTGSGDVSILAWTGESGGFNSCLPAHITVFKEPVAPHLPQSIPDAEMVTMSHSSFDLETALNLYDRLGKLSAPWFAAIRMKLPCIVFQLPPFPPCRRIRSTRIYSVDTAAFGSVEIKTKQNLSRMEHLYLVHPWLDTLLEQDDKNNLTGEATSLPSPNTDDEESSGEEVEDSLKVSDEEVEDTLEFTDEHVECDFSSPAAQSPPPTDNETRARRLVARLRQPFGAILLTLTSTGGREEYKRVAADSMIKVQIQENFPLADILDNVRTLDVL